MGRKTFSIRAACLICKFSICKFNKNTNSCCIISHHNIQLLISKDTLERKKNPKNQPLRCHHTEQHSCSFFSLFPAIRAIKISNINREIYPQHRSTQIEHSEKAILNNVITQTGITHFYIPGDKSKKLSFKRTATSQLLCFITHHQRIG